MKRLYLIIGLPLLLLIALFIAAPYGEITVTVPGENDQSETANVNTDDTMMEEEDAGLPHAFATVEYQGEEGKTAFELLSRDHVVTYQQFDFGVLIEAIDGEESTNDRFWLFYVNGEQAQVGADQYTTTDGDTLLWRLEESTF